MRIGVQIDENKPLVRGQLCEGAVEMLDQLGGRIRAFCAVMLGFPQGSLIAYDDAFPRSIWENWDLPSIIEIYNAAIPSGCSTGDSEPAKAEDKLAWFNAHDRGSHPLWVAEESGMVVGWAGLCPFYGRPAFAKTAELSLYIAPQHRRHGFGRRLVRRVIKRCPSLGVDTLLAFVFAHNAPTVLMLEGLGSIRRNSNPDL